MAEDCKQELCAHYIGKDRFHFYRHRFVWIVFFFTVLTIAMYTYVVCSFSASHKQIVEADSLAINRIENQICQAKKDSCFNVNEKLATSMMEYMQTTKSMLELESTKVQSDYTILSLWAGILMIIFLVFSIYSMFKTDEVLRQSREGLKSVEEAEDKAGKAIQRVEEATNEEITKVTNKANEEATNIQHNAEQTIEDVKKDIEDMRDLFEKDVKEKSESFQKSYEEMMKKMKETSAQNASLIKQLVDSIKDATVEQKGPSITGEQLEGGQQKGEAKE